MSLTHSRMDGNRIHLGVGRIHVVFRHVCTNEQEACEKEFYRTRRMELSEYQYRVSANWSSITRVYSAPVPISSYGGEDLPPPPPSSGHVNRDVEGAEYVEEVD